MGIISGNLRIVAETVTDGDIALTAAIQRTKLILDSLMKYTIPLGDFRIWNAFATVLTGTPNTDDLGLVGGTFGTGSPTISSGDLKAAGSTTRYGRVLVRMPAEYVAAETVNLRFHAGMQTTIADVAATLDVEAYLSDGDAGVTGSDLCTTSATTINSLTSANKDFVITSTNLEPGSLLDIRVAILVNDAATVTAVIGQFGLAQLLCDVKG